MVEEYAEAFEFMPKEMAGKINLSEELRKQFNTTATAASNIMIATSAEMAATMDPSLGFMLMRSMLYRMAFEFEVLSRTMAGATSGDEVTPVSPLLMNEMIGGAYRSVAADWGGGLCNEFVPPMYRAEPGLAN